MISQETVEFSLLVDGRRVSAHWHPSASISFSRSRKAQNRAVAQCTILLILHLWWDGGGAGYGGTRNSGRTASGLARSLGISSWTVTAHATNAARYGSTTWRYSRSPVWLAALWHWLASLLLLWTCWPLFLVRGGWQTLLQACRRTETTSEWRSSCISIIADSTVLNIIMMTMLLNLVPSNVAPASSASSTRFRWTECTRSCETLTMTIYDSMTVTTVNAWFCCRPCLREAHRRRLIFVKKILASRHGPFCANGSWRLHFSALRHRAPDPPPNLQKAVEKMGRSGRVAFLHKNYICECWMPCYAQLPFPKARFWSPSSINLLG